MSAVVPDPASSRASMTTTSGRSAVWARWASFWRRPAAEGVVARLPKAEGTRSTISSSRQGVQAGARPLGQGGALADPVVLEVVVEVLYHGGQIQVGLALAGPFGGQFGHLAQGFGEGSVRGEVLGPGRGEKTQ
jgi:hypothetical protein